MYKHILLPIDGSKLADRAARHGIELARALNAATTVVTVTVPWEAHFSREVAVVVPDVIIPRNEYDRKVEAAARHIMRCVTDVAKAASVASKAVHLSHTHPYLAIIDMAATEGCDLIVMASHGRRGFSGFLLGSETVKLLTHSKIPVLVYRDR